MQILSRKGKALIIALIGAMLITLGASFAVWNGRSAQAAIEASVYAHAQIGQTVTFGRYWQKAGATYDQKDPIEWIVVDKDENSRQLTLLSKYLIASGNYFGLCFPNTAGNWSQYKDNALVDGFRNNPAWCDSTARAFLNNLMRWDIGGDYFDPVKGFDNDQRIPSLKSIGKLQAAIGYSDAEFQTSYNKADVPDLIASNTGFYTKSSSSYVYYRRPTVTDPSKRLATNGFLNEAFTEEEQAMIAPRTIAGEVSQRWPRLSFSEPLHQSMPATTDKVWIPSAMELNLMETTFGEISEAEKYDWLYSSDFSTSDTFEYFKNYTKYSQETDIAKVLMAGFTPFAGQANGLLGNYALMDYVSDVSLNDPPMSYYWTRSASAHSMQALAVVGNNGNISEQYTDAAYMGIRPAILLKY